MAKEKTVPTQTTSGMAKVPMTIKKSTKGTHVYHTEDGKISFYLPKDLVKAETAPKAINVWIEEL